MAPRRATARLLPLLCVGAAVGGGAACTAASSSRPLSGQPPEAVASGVFLTTSRPKAPIKTIGFVRIETRGSGVSDAAGKSDTELDPAVHALLAEAIHDAGAEGAILVDFAEALPPTAATHPWGVVRNSPPGRIDTRSRWLEVNAELFVFVRPAPEVHR